MPDGLTPPTRLVSALPQAAFALLVFAAVGPLCGLLWHRLWDAPTGTVYQGQWYTSEAGLREDFAGTGLYVAIAAVVGLVLGALAAWVLDRSELVTLVAVVLGAVLGGYLMLVVGQHLSPADPHALATTAKDGQELDGQLHVPGWPPRLAMPFAALVGLLVVFSMTGGRITHQAPQGSVIPGQPGNPRVGSGRLTHGLSSFVPGSPSPGGHVSTTPPPPPPPSGPPSWTPNGPPGGPPGGPPPEYLESSGGAPVPPGENKRSGLRKGIFVGVGAVALAGIGVGAWAAWSFLATGPQPAEALPAGTLGYVSIDLDPSGGQKIEALRTLNKFPAFKDEVGIGADDDIRKEIFSRILDEADCEGLDYGDDIEPWIGDRAAVAAVDTGEDEPLPVVVIQVEDAGKAEDGLAAIKKCSGGDDGGWVIEGDWAVVTESEKAAQKVVDDASDGSLADDEDFQRWTDEAGDSGIMTMYAGPAAGDYFAEHADELGGLFGASDYACAVPEALGDDMGGDGSGDLGTEGDGDYGCDIDESSELPDDVKEKFADFEGMAATVRFSDGAIELEAAGDATVAGQGLLSSGGAADVVSTLPADTIAAFGLGFDDGWFSDVVDYVAPMTGQTPDELMAMLSDSSGLDLPDDAETLAGDAAALSLGSGFDPEAFFESPDGSGIPVALKIKGDPDEIEKVLDKLRDLAGPEAGVMESDFDGDMIVIGPDADYRDKVLGDGGLGDDDVFKDVIREADQAGTVLFVNVNQVQDAIEELAGDDDEFLDNLEPVSGFGVTGWIDDDVAHAVVRLTTD